MSLAACLELPAPPIPPTIVLPNFGSLQAARQSLYDLPDLSNYIMRLQDVAALALAPLRRFLEMIEVFVAVKECITAIPDALMPPSPTPIYNCLKALAKVFVQLLQYIPPFNYIPTIIDLCDYMIITVDEVVGLFTLLDDKINQQKAILAEALELGDLELIDITDCVSGETNALVINSMDILKYFTPLLSVILSPIARLMPVPILREKLKELADIPQTLNDIQETIEATEGPPVLDSLVETMFVLRNMMIVVANVLSPFVGQAANRQPVAAPTFDNF